MQSSNPALKQLTNYNPAQTATQTMTLQGTINKIALLLLCTLTTAAYAWITVPKNPAMANTLLMVGLIGGLIFAMITIFKADWAPVTAPIYALLEGLFLGTISVMFERTFEAQGLGGIVKQAVTITFGIFAAMLFAYKSGVIKPTEKFKAGVVAATGGVALVYFVSIILGFFGISVPFLHSAGPIGIGISLVILVIASLNLILDFDMIERGIENHAPAKMEWYAAFGLMVTLVWIYLEVLRLLSKLNRR